MTTDELEPDPPLSPEELHAVSALGAGELAEVDRALLRHATARWRKVAFVVASAMSDSACEEVKLPDIFFAQRVRELVNLGALEASGNLGYMRFSEVRLPEPQRVGRT